jgi:hypothetical protein
VQHDGAGLNCNRCITLGTEADVEVGFADPHPVQDAASLRATATIAHTCSTPGTHAQRRPFPNRSRRLAAASHSACRTATSPCLLIRPS